jgi:superoxide dismutase, Fe-Mn family
LKHLLPELPYAVDALAPSCSAETLQYHHGKHHQAYVDKLNALQSGTEFESMSLDDIVTHSTGELHNNAAQHWNHSFFWTCMSPGGGGEPGGLLAKAMVAEWGSFAAFRAAFFKSAVANFGSGWTWLVQQKDGKLAIVNMGNAGTPMTTQHRALMTVDVWEHAYYIDYRNARQQFVETFLDKLVDWRFAAKQLA